MCSGRGQELSPVDCLPSEMTHVQPWTGTEHSSLHAIHFSIIRTVIYTHVHVHVRVCMYTKHIHVDT